MRPRQDSSAQPNAIVRRLWDIDVRGPVIHDQQPKPYPPISSIPPTSAARIAAATPPAEHVPSEPVPASDSSSPAVASTSGSGSDSDTVLYLAYGSNLAAETFLGTRKIRPLSQLNVSAPSLRLTFDLPGLPYREPCFANTALRMVPSKPPIDLPQPRLHPPRTTGEVGDWDKGLVGVVYEVTPADFARIVATEGGGSSYHDILVPCIPLPPTVGVPEKPPLPDLPRPFLAHTLFAPRLPDPPPDGGEDQEGEDEGGDAPSFRLPRCLRRLLLPLRRPSPAHAQPSLRYLGLLRAGAAEHDLPGDYQAFLASLQPYTPTTLRQRLGGALFTLLMSPLFLVVFGLSLALADDRGRTPAWLGAGMTVGFNLVWMAYDGVFRPVFGEGERTVEESRGAGAMRLLGKRQRRRSSAVGSLGYSDEAVEEEEEEEDGLKDVEADAKDLL